MIITKVIRVNVNRVNVRMSEMSISEHGGKGTNLTCNKMIEESVLGHTYTRSMNHALEMARNYLNIGNIPIYTFDKYGKLICVERLVGGEVCTKQYTRPQIYIAFDEFLWKELVWERDNGQKLLTLEIN